MKTKLLVVLILMVGLPLGLLVWLGMRVAREERDTARAQVRDILLDQLGETDQAIGRYFDEVERQLLSATELSGPEAAVLRNLVRTEPLVGHLLLLTPEGQIMHPDLAQPLNDAEREFLQRTKPLLLDRDLVRVAAGETDLPPPVAVSKESPRQSYAVKGRVATSLQPTSGPTHGWYLWYWGRGLNLIFWRKLATGNVVAVELPRSRWMADLLARLPSTSLDKVTGAHSRVQLSDSGDNLIYQWGSYEPAIDAQPLAERALSEPLGSWRLKYFVAEEGFAALAQRSIYFNLLTAVAVSGVALLAMAIWWYRESLRELREAATRVDFVNQVSHELKTPLTNIRMYAELLQRDLEESDAQSKSMQRAKVIMTESSRLSRLIGNVLTFAQAGRHTLDLKPRPGVVDELIESVLESFEPTLKQREIEVQFAGNATARVEFDVDAVEQILVNLISNVEKYAAEGKWLAVESHQEHDRTTIRIADHGPGIGSKESQRVFEPFYRIDNRLEGAAGAGIGLSIARSLAELHGGHLRLVSSPQGALFVLELHTPQATTQEN